MWIIRQSLKVTQYGHHQLHSFARLKRSIINCMHHHAKFESNWMVTTNTSVREITRQTFLIDHRQWAEQLAPLGARFPCQSINLSIQSPRCPTILSSKRDITGPYGCVYLAQKLNCITIHQVFINDNIIDWWHEHNKP